MVRPQEVTAPKEKIDILKILEDGTQTKKGYSVALVKWSDKLAIALRWDGDDLQEKGFPVTVIGYHPAWFVLPDRLTDLYSRDYREYQESIQFIVSSDQKE